MPGLEVPSVPQSWRDAAIVALCYWAAATVSLALTQGEDGMATLWPGSGILLFAFISFARGTVVRTAGLAAVASIVANVSSGSSAWLAGAFTAANISEAAIAAHLWQRFGGKRTLFLGWADVGRFAGASAIAAAASATIAWALSGRPGGLFILSWFTTVLLGLLVVTPVLLVGAELRRSRAVPATPAPMSGPVSSPVPVPRPATVIVTLVAVATVAAAVFWQASYPLLFVPLIALLVATFRLGVLGASAGVLTIAVIASGFSYAGYGPIALIHASGLVKSFFLQAYLLSLFSTALPVAALLASRDRLLADNIASERAHRLLAEASSDIIVRFALGGVPLYVSPACRGILGYSPGEMMRRGAVRDIHPDDRAHVLATWAEVTGGRNDAVCRYRQRTRAGGEVWLEAAYRIAGPEATGGAAEVVATVRDITARRHAEIAREQAVARLEEAHAMLADAEAVAHLGHWRADLRTGTIVVSPEVMRIHDLRRQALATYEESLALYHAEDRDRVRAEMQAAVASGEPFAVEARIVTGRGAIRHIVSKGSVKLDALGRPASLFGTLQDVTEWVEIERELDAARQAAEAVAASALCLADTDALTGVANRRQAMRFLDEAFAGARRGTRKLAVAVVDIDHFKRVNDDHGHAVGDAVLVRVAQSLAGKLRGGDLIGRLGGEEFVVVAAITAPSEALALGDRIRGIVEEACRADDLPRVTVSVGVAVHDAHASAPDLLAAADRALYAAKHAGRNATRIAA